MTNDTTSAETTGTTDLADIAAVANGSNGANGAHVPTEPEVAAAVPEGTPAEAKAPSFDDLDLHPDIRQALADMGYFAPTAVQTAVFGPVSEGKDLLVQSRTGTGKTTAFGLPTLSKIVPTHRQPQALILAPTRELALQVARELTKIGAHRGIVVEAIYGGAPIGKQITNLKNGVHVVVGTPGRVLDHIGRRTLDTKTINTFILDECDEMLSMGFLEDILRVVKELPEKKQTLLFSATMPDEVARYSRQHMTNPVQMSLSRDGQTVADIHHAYYIVSGIARSRDLLKVIYSEEPESAIIFCNMRDETTMVAKFLQKQGLDAEALSSDLSQNDRERVMGRMKAKNLRFLCATDVAARGIDISDLTHVINYSVPESPESYVHRTGRTGRAGKKGTAISLVGPRELGNFRFVRLTFGLKPEERFLPKDSIFEGKLKVALPPVGVPQPPDPVQILIRGVTGTPSDLETKIFEKLYSSQNGKRVLAALVARELDKLSTRTKPRTPHVERSADAAPTDAPREDRPFGDRGPRPDGDRPRRSFDDRGPRGDRPDGDRPRRSFDGPRGDRPEGDRPRRFDRDDRGPRPEGDAPREARPEGEAPRPEGDRPRRFDRDDRGPRRDDRGPRPEGEAPRADRPDGDARPDGDRGPRRFDRDDRGPRRFDRDDRGPRRDDRGPRPEGDAPREARPEGEAPREARPEGEAPRGDRPEGDRGPRRFEDRGPRTDRPEGDRPRRFDRDDRGPRRDDRGPRTDRPEGEAPRAEGDAPREARPEGDRGGRERRPWGERGERDRGPRRDGGERRDEAPTVDTAVANATNAPAEATEVRTEGSERTDRPEANRDGRDRNDRGGRRFEGRDRNDRGDRNRDRNDRGGRGNDRTDAPAGEQMSLAVEHSVTEVAATPAKVDDVADRAVAKADDRKGGKRGAKSEPNAETREFWETWAEEKSTRPAPAPAAEAAPAASASADEEKSDRPSRGRERGARGGRDRGGRSGGRGRDKEATSSDAAAPAEAPVATEAKSERSGGRTKRDTAVSPPPAVAADGAQARLFVSLGKKNGVTADDLRTLLSAPIGGDPSRIGSISLRDSHAHVRVAEEYADKIIAKVNGTQHNEQDVTVERARA